MARWLADHYDKEPEIWLVYYRRKTGRPRIAYIDAVEEALCCGWIDSTVKKIDDERFAQRFSPRRKTSTLSQTNIERIHKLIAEGEMTEAGRTSRQIRTLQEGDNVLHCKSYSY